MGTQDPTTPGSDWDWGHRTQLSPSPVDLETGPDCSGVHLGWGNRTGDRSRLFRGPVDWGNRTRLLRGSLGLGIRTRLGRGQGQGHGAQDPTGPARG